MTKKTESGGGILCPHGEDYCRICVEARGDIYTPCPHGMHREGCFRCIALEIRTTSATGGQKGVKQERFDLIPVEALEALARHYGKGAEKYEGNQWRKGYEWSKSFAAMMRHAWKFWSGEDIDPETGSPHIIAVAWHAFCLFTFSRDFPEYDDRYQKDK